MWGYTEALGALHEMVAEAGDDFSEVGLPSLRIGPTTTLAAGGKVPHRAIQREGRWTYIRNKPEDAGIEN